MDRQTAMAISSLHQVVEDKIGNEWIKISYSQSETD